jgi:hypothetical protein
MYRYYLDTLANISESLGRLEPDQVTYPILRDIHGKLGKIHYCLADDRLKDQEFSWLSGFIAGVALAGLLSLVVLL